MTFKFPDRLQISLESRFLAIVALTLALTLVATYLMVALIGAHWLAFLFGFLIGFILSIGMVILFTRRMRLGLKAIHHGLLNLVDNDFSVTLGACHIAELGTITDYYNHLAERLRKERQTIFQRELLLDTIIENSSMCVLIADQNDRIIYSNHIAEKLLNNSKAINGLIMNDLFTRRSPTLNETVAQEKSGIFRMPDDSSNNLYHLSCGRFQLNTRRHRLVLIKEMTREINRQEAESWKNVIRVISHELNNSLAPISSMAHSGQLLLAKSKYEQLPDVFSTLAERADHLKHFVGRYAEVAKLPVPHKAPVEWDTFYRGLTIGYSFSLLGSLPDQPGFFDAVQLQQVLLNLLKNASESGSHPSEISLSITQNRKVSLIEVADRGTGMPKRVLESALLPFYTTKPTGSGIGLPLCREIVEAHEGHISLSNRNGGGLRVAVTLPLSQTTP